jgi:ABC-type lipoprotein release transport system permease subunit
MSATSETDLSRLRIDRDDRSPSRRDFRRPLAHRHRHRVAGEVMRTLGFPSATIFLLIAGEGLMMAVVGGVLGAGLARVIINPDLFSAGAFIPVFGVNNTNLLLAIGLSALIGIVAGSIPATMAARLKIVEALRRVA